MSADVVAPYSVLTIWQIAVPFDADAYGEKLADRLGDYNHMAYLDSYLRVHRKKWGLSQDELAGLIGSRSGATVSRLEGLRRHPNLRTAFAVQIIFGEPLEKLFPKVFDQVEDALMRRANALHEELQGTAGISTRLKLDLLDNLFKRASERHTA
ncbi:helix-turn-helix transcriptional regulator [uncultured Bradyrhizobium sp.]|uniref:helix-turn-helix transcriptional regulator n=1 Tax=uncultured Bradyrhizobium sp. TaxID=199684 RepID=UPI0035CBCEA0